MPLSKLLMAVGYLKQVNDLRTLHITRGAPLISPLFADFIGALEDFEFEDVSLSSNGCCRASCLCTGGRHQAHLGAEIRVFTRTCSWR